MPEATKKRHTDEEMITIRLRVHRNNASKIKEFAETVEAGGERNYTVAEVFPEYVGNDKQVAIRAYRYRENLTQRQVAELTGIPQRHISEMENGKRVIGKEMAKRLSKVLKADYKMFL
ncbi:MAG: helix-turn-helix domain-containing protein [Desulfoprunum sp.]|nr:helix-turn-helix domain-containing protein [Desulfoprunum sp.]